MTQRRSLKARCVEPMEERKSIPRASLRRQEIREERKMEGHKEEEEKEELQFQRYVLIESQLSSSLMFLD